MLRLRYVLAILKEAWDGPYIRSVLAVWGAVGFFSTIKGELVRRTSKWADTRLVDWAPMMSLQTWVILGLGLALAVGFEAAYRLHCRQSEELAAFQSEDDDGTPQEEPTLDEALDGLAADLLGFLDDSPNAYQTGSVDRDLLLMHYQYDFVPRVRKMKKSVSASVDSETTLAMFDLEIRKEADITELAEFLTKLAATLRAQPISTKPE
jgi:hypothetical protein